MKKDDPNDSKHQSSPSTFQCLSPVPVPRKNKTRRKKPKKDDREVPLPPFPFFLISSPKRFHQKKQEKTNTKVSSGETPPVGTRTSCLVLLPRFPSWPPLRLTEERTTTSPGKKKEIHQKVFPIDKEYSHSVKSRSERLTRRGG